MPDASMLASTLPVHAGYNVRRSTVMGPFTALSTPVRVRMDLSIGFCNRQRVTHGRGQFALAFRQMSH